jgi:hypothetical protein
MSKYLNLLLTLIIIVTTLYQPLTQRALGSSPSFVRQEVKDGSQDWWDHEKEEFSNVVNFSDISAVSYSSNGEFLNTTIFTNSSFVKEPSKFMPSYGMLINADTDFDTGWLGHDYLLRISWNNDTKTWNSVLEEWSSARILRTLDQKNNYTGFFDEGEQNKYVHLSLNLADIGFPQQYVVLFFIDYGFDMNNPRKAISDYSNWVNIPPLQFSISTSPSSIELRPGEEKIVEVQFNSTTPSTTSFITPHLSFTTNKVNGIDDPYFVPNEIDLPRYGLATSSLHIKASSNATSSPHTLQIFGEVSFPVQYVGGTELKSQLGKAIFESMTVNTNLAVTLLPPLTFQERFSNFWSVYGDPINLFVGGLTAGLAAILVDNLRKSIKRRKARNNKHA